MKLKGNSILLAMNKFYKLLILILFPIIFINCSFDNRTTAGIWKDLSEELTIKKERAQYKPVFIKGEKFKKEISNDIVVNISKPITNDNWLEQNFTAINFVPHLQYENKKNLVFKSKKIGKIKGSIFNSEFEPLIINENIFFYDIFGSIYNYSTSEEKIIWKYNFYKKRFKKHFFKINLTIESNNLIVSDNLGYLYSIDLESGKLIWAKNYGIPFRSNIKIDDAYLFLINQDNKFYIIQKNNGEKKADVETFPSFLKNTHQASISVDPIKKNVYFITTAGEVYSLNYKTSTINWLYKSTLRNFEKKVDLFFSSPIIYKEDSIIISTSVSTISLNTLNGTLNWELPFSTYLRPVVLGEFVFLVSKDGFILSLDRKTGKVIWSRNLFNKSKKFNKQEIGEINSLMLISNQIFMTSSKGYFLFANYQNGKIINYAKVDKRGFFTKPIVANKNIYIINRKMRVLVFN
jgi:outer membrane protein assembly factor BamB